MEIDELDFNIKIRRNMSDTHNKHNPKYMLLGYKYNGTTSL